MAIAPFPIPASAGDAALAQLDAARESIAAVGAGLVAVSSEELDRLAASAAGVIAAAEAARAAIVLEASSRGVIAGSDHPRTKAWVEQTCRDAEVPVTSVMARQLQDIAQTCTGHDVAALREAVTAGRLPLESAAVVAKVYRRLREKIEHPHWDLLADILIDWAAEGARPSQLHSLEERMIGQYGTADALQEEHDRAHQNRRLTDFRTTRDGMRTATLKLDPASEATLTAALHALSKPQPGAGGEPDLRSSGQRRADALLSIAGFTTTARPDVPGTGAKARITITMTLADLLADLADCDQAGGVDGRGSDTAEGTDSRNSVRSGTRVRSRTRGYAAAGFGQTLTPTEAGMLACDAQIIPTVLGTNGEILDLGRAHRTITPGQSAALHQRDQGCTYPGCSIPPQWCDGHHIVYWALGGRTDMKHLALLCRHHHTVVHRHDHTATVHPIHGVLWTRRDGTPIGNGPRITLP
ncbi:HNH endonuclease signature motif containing protein [Mobilicoccus caccae]|uniref:HNH nuclease domain-containing protein n=1 Tax=Mobilicoccus caccae TaxID=1859295 RepID=A0ABQ6IPS6_9MICO|nr:HNH endonuclease signature motif containing protein [Mobilicoccus caccae]GMA38688.1 hypothetical protein GCM10025883_07330 [Mobilicoccus caccae]